MDAAKNAVKSFTSKVGHKTDVDENVHSAVVNETVKPHRHEETTQAVDKEGESPSTIDKQPPWTLDQQLLFSMHSEAL